MTSATPISPARFHRAAPRPRARCRSPCWRSRTPPVLRARWIGSSRSRTSASASASDRVSSPRGFPRHARHQPRLRGVEPRLQGAREPIGDGVTTAEPRELPARRAEHLDRAAVAREQGLQRRLDPLPQGEDEGEEEDHEEGREQGRRPPSGGTELVVQNGGDDEEGRRDGEAEDHDRHRMAGQGAHLEEVLAEEPDGEEEPEEEHRSHEDPARQGHAEMPPGAREEQGPPPRSRTGPGST